MKVEADSCSFLKGLNERKEILSVQKKARIEKRRNERERRVGAGHRVGERKERKKCAKERKEGREVDRHTRAEVEPSNSQRL